MKTLYITAVTMLALALQSPAQIHTITQTGFSFSPQNLTVNVGDTIRWQWTSGAHTTTSVTVPAGAAPWDAPLSNSSQQFQYVVTTAGTYSYVCVPHQGMGMTGTFTAEGTTGSELIKSYPAQPAVSPFSGKLVLQPGNNKNGIAVVYNLTGRACLQFPFNGYTTADTETLPAGIYVLEIRYNDGIVTKQKVVKK